MGAGGVSVGYLVGLLDRLQTMPIEEVMRDDERRRGYLPVRPGERAWLSADDWPDHVVVSVAGNVVRIIAIIAREPGKGAFRRLIAAITAAGLAPQVHAPSREMGATLCRWGWVAKARGFGFDREEWMEPPATPGPRP